MSTPPPDPPDEITEALRIPITPTSPSTSPLVDATVNLTLGNVALKTKVPLPSGPTTLRQLLPVFHAFTQAIVHAAEERTLAAGHSVSCKKGCAACCRQLVPIAEPDAHALAALVENLPEPQRSHIRARFDHIHQTLLAANLFDPLSHFASLNENQVADLSRSYFQLHLACPFLEEESCSIYPQRPAVCREYLVTSDPALCQSLSPLIDGIQLPAFSSRALARTTDESASPPRRVPLSLALHFAAHHPEPPPTSTGPQLLQQFLSHLSKPSPPIPFNT